MGDWERKPDGLISKKSSNPHRTLRKKIENCWYAQTPSPGGYLEEE